MLDGDMHDLHDLVAGAEPQQQTWRAAETPVIPAGAREHLGVGDDRFRIGEGTGELIDNGVIHMPFLSTEVIQASDRTSRTFGSKPALLRQVLDQALAGDDEPIPVAARPWFQPVWEAPAQDTALDAYAQVCTLIGGRAAQIFEAVRRAADAVPEVTELWNTLQGNRRAGAHMVVKHLQ